MHRPLTIPDIVARRHAKWSHTPASAPGPEAATWRLSSRLATRFLKVARLGREPSLADERDRTRWAAGTRLAVPTVIEYGSADGLEWLLTEGLVGTAAVDASMRADPERLVPKLAAGLRRFHQTPTKECPFQFRLEEALAHVRRRVARGAVRAAEHLHPEHQHLTPAQAIAQLEREAPTSEDLVLCHGDYCPPNVLIVGDRVAGYVDLGEMGVADRWWDLAVATWSLTWNLGPGWDAAFLAAYGIAPDPNRLRFYRLLYDLAS